ncbi:MAG: LysM peptidoglycan-binding domain-containing protein [Bacteroidetes bacterium]|nr:LysM peptidoglycan-binding domain-containing protein [Bacteroidota bacterium]
MDINQFIRIFRNNLVLLIAIPLLLAIIVYYLTRNQDKVYESETIIYTGVTTGYSIESTAQRPTDFFSTSAQFDNMINLINSRQTIVESAIMLLAQSLSLESYNPQYISNENYDKLQKFIPKYVKDLVVKNGKSGVLREKEEQIRSLEKEIRSLEKEISKKKTRAIQELSGNGVDTTTRIKTGLTKDDAPLTTPASTADHAGTITHTVQAGESLLTISQKYGVSIGKLREINDFSSQNLVVGQQVIISTGIQSGSVMPQNYDENDASTYSESDDVAYSELINTPAVETTQSASTGVGMAEKRDDGGLATIDKDPVIPPGIRKDDYDKTVQNLVNYYNSSDSNFVYGLLHYGESKHYSIRSLKTLQIYRINNSDLVRLVFLSDDPGICQQTLKIIAQVFVKNYKVLKANQTDLVVEYFKKQVDSADAVLQAAEDRLLRFNKKNNIINYTEQTKYIAEQKEDLDLYYQNEQIRMAQSSASLRELETNLTRRDSIYLKSDMINQKRKEYAEVTERILVNELAEDYDDRIGNEIQRLRLKSEQLRDDIKLYIDQLYLYSHSTQGMPIARLLDEWLKSALAYEEAKASLVVLSRRKIDFVKTYQRFAPLGAMLKRIEREITVAEQSYLELLRSLNLAKMRQQNLQMATNIRVVDPPYFPIQANPSKAKYLVIAAAMIGFILVAFIILVLEYFDSSLKTPNRIADQVGLKIAGAFPIVDSASDMKNLVYISNRLVEMIIQNIKLKLKHNSLYPVSKPYLILFFSTEGQVGKTFLAGKIANKLRTYGEKVLLLNYSKEEESVADEDMNFSYSYPIRDNFVEINNLQELISSNTLRRENYQYDYIFLEIPSIIHNAYPLEILQSADIGLLVIKSTSHWEKADAAALGIIRDISKEEPMVILNEAEDYAIQEMISGFKREKQNTLLQKVKYYATYPFRIRIQVKEN